MTTETVTTKYCPDCQRDLPLEEFWRNRSQKLGRQHYCKPCWKVRVDRSYAQNRDHQLYLRRNGHLKRKYGITVEDYDRLLEQQSGGCAICGDDLRAKGKRLHLDHDHSTNNIRGILCHWCNLMLGNAKDNPDRLRAAIRYLEQS